MLEHLKRRDVEERARSRRGQRSTLGPTVSARSPYGAFVHRVHGGPFGTVEHAGELVELRHAANHSVKGRQERHVLLSTVLHSVVGRESMYKGKSEHDNEKNMSC